MDQDQDMEGIPQTTALVPVPVPVAVQPQLPAVSLPPSIEPKSIQVKVHIRRPDRDTWVYLGRGIVNFEKMHNQSSRVVLRAVTSSKVLAVFTETSDMQAEKRGNFVVVGCVEHSRVVSWSLNALNNSETIRLLTQVELACYKSRQATADPRMYNKSRRRIERVIKDDRRRRHRRRKEQESMIDAFAKSNISSENDMPTAANLDDMATSGPPPAF